MKRRFKKETYEDKLGYREKSGRNCKKIRILIILHNSKWWLNKFCSEAGSVSIAKVFSSQKCALINLVIA